MSSVSSLANAAIVAIFDFCMISRTSGIAFTIAWLVVGIPFAAVLARLPPQIHYR
jgi:hypothetical protein